MSDVTVWNRELSAAAVAEVYGGGKRTNPAVVARNGLLAYWPLGENNLLKDQLGDHPLALPSSVAAGDDTVIGTDVTAPLPEVGANPGGSLDYPLPTRVGANSNQSIIVNRFAGSGYEVMSRGYMGPAHEEMSVYNALPYHNLSVIDYGLSGSASVDPSLTDTIRVQDQIGKVRGLDQRSTLHCGPFGSDAAYGSVPVLTYVTTPSYHKVNRNAKTIFRQADTGWAGEFNGSSTSVDIGSYSTWNELIGGAGIAAKPFTISAWVYQHEDSTKAIVDISEGDAQVRMTTTDKIYFGRNGATDGVVRSSANSVPAETWTHVACTFAGGEGGEMKVYINGVDDTVVDTIIAGPTVIGSSAINIGSRNNSSRFFDGSISDVAIWNKALTEAEVGSVYNQGYAGAPTIGEGQREFCTENLIAWYRFNSDFGDTDSSILNQISTTLNTNGVASSLTIQSAVAPPTLEKRQVYDNWYVQHPIPRSKQQYSWITASIAEGNSIYGLDKPACYNKTTLCTLLKESTIASRAEGGQARWFTGSVNYVGIGTSPAQGVSLSKHLLEPPAHGATTWSIRFPAHVSEQAYDTPAPLATTNPLHVPPIGVRLVDDWPDSTSGIEAWNSKIGGKSANANPFTIAVWINALSASGVWTTIPDPSTEPLVAMAGNTIIGFPGEAAETGHDASYEQRIHLTLDANNRLLGVQTMENASGTSWVKSRANLGLIGGGWHHIVYTYGGGSGTTPGDGNAAIFVDGVDVTADVSKSGEPDHAIDGPPYVGAAPFNPYGFYGDIASVAIFDKDLTDETAPFPGGSAIKALYNSGSYYNPAQLGLGTNFVGWYRFNPLPNVGRGAKLGHGPAQFEGRIVNEAPGAPANSDAIPVMGPPPAYKSSSRLRFENSGPPDPNQLNLLNLSRNGPYGYPTWKQIRAGETKVARTLRKKNQIGVLLPPPFVPRLSVEGAVVGFDRGLKANKFVDYYESPVVSTAKPVFFAFEDNDASPDTANNVAVEVSYQNNIDFFSNPGLNNRLNLSKIADEGNAYNMLAEFAVNTNLSFMVRYGQTVYPREINMYKNEIRERDVYSISPIWNNCPTTRWSGIVNPNLQSNPADPALVDAAENKFLYSFLYGDVQYTFDSQHSRIRGASVWPLDFEYSGTAAQSADPVPGWYPWMNAPTGSTYPNEIGAGYVPWQDGKGNAGRGAGELMNTYSRFCFPSGYNTRQGRNTAPSTSAAYTGSIRPACSYVMPIFGGWRFAQGSSIISDFYFLNGITAVGQVPWTAGTAFDEDSQSEAGVTPTPFRENSEYPVPYWKTSPTEEGPSGGGGVAPYITYDQYARNIRYSKKDTTIVPEFRLSLHLEDYIGHHNSNFLDNVPKMFAITGSTLGPVGPGEARVGEESFIEGGTNQTKDFYKVYSTTDFMKYFKVVDDDFAGQTNALGIPVKRHSIKLSCEALVQFLPYKGFYPAERTIELGTLLSKSLGPVTISPTLISGGYDSKGGALRRILYEPLISPGILYNTIKSGIAVSNFVIGSARGAPTGFPAGSSSLYPDGKWSLPLQFYSQVSHFPLYEDLLRDYSQGEEDRRGGIAGTGRPTWVCDVTRQIGDRDFTGLAAYEALERSYSSPNISNNPGGCAPIKRGIHSGTAPQIMSQVAYQDRSLQYGSAPGTLDNQILAAGTADQQASATTGSYMMPLLNLIPLDQYPSLPWIPPGPEFDDTWNAGSGNGFGGYFYQKIPFEAIRDPDKYLGARSIYNGWLYDTGLGMSAFHHSASLLNPDNRLLINNRGDIRTKIKYSGQSQNQLYKMAIDNFLCETYNFFMKGPKNATFLSKQEEDFLPVVEGQYYGLQIDLGTPQRWGWDTMIETMGSSSKEPGDWTTLIMPFSGDAIRCTASLLPPEAIPTSNRTFGMYSRASAFGAPLAIYGQPSKHGMTDAQYDAFTIQNNVIWSYEHVLPPYFYGSAKANIIYKAAWTGKVSVNEILANSVVEYEKDHFWGEASIYPPQGKYMRQGIDILTRPPRYPGKSLANYFGYLGSASYDNWTNYGNGLTGSDARLQQEGMISHIDSSVNLLEKLLVVPEGTTEQEARWMIQPKFETPVLNFYNAPATQISIGQGYRRHGGYTPSGFDEALTFNSPSQAYDGRSVVGRIQESAKSLVPITGGSNPMLEVRGMWHQYGKTPDISDSGLTLTLKDVPTTLSSSHYGTINVKPLAEVVGFQNVSKPIGSFADARRVEEAVVCIPFITNEAQKRFFKISETSLQYTKQLAILNKYIFPPTFDYLINPTVTPLAFYAFEFDLELSQDDLVRMWQNLPPASCTDQEFRIETAEVTIRDLVDRLLESSDELQWIVFKVKKRAEKDYNIYTRKNLVVDSLPIAQPSLNLPYSFNWPYDYFSIVERIKIQSDVVYATEDLITESDDEEMVPPSLIEYIPGIITIPPRRRPLPPIPVRPAPQPRPRPQPRLPRRPRPPRRPRLQLRRPKISLRKRFKGPYRKSRRANLRRPLRTLRTPLSTRSRRSSRRSQRRSSSRMGSGYRRR